jgi:hypothetical protein
VLKFIPFTSVSLPSNDSFLNFAFRNEVWRYQHYRGWLPDLISIMKKGFIPGLALTVATVAIDKVTGFSSRHHHHDDGHGDHH